MTAEELIQALICGSEIAVIDVRHHSQFVAGHILRSVPLALGQIERRSQLLFPRRSVQIVVVDDGAGLADRAALRLRELGYSDVTVLSGGIDAWSKAGRPLISGEFAISKAFGEHVERTHHTPFLTPEELHSRREAGEQIIVFDSRPVDEYEKIAVPGSIVAPGVELVYRFDEIVRSEDTTVVVTCAGRTRGILGAQALINARVKNPVYSLRNGVFGWELAGFKSQTGAGDRAPPPDPTNLDRIRRRAVFVEKKFDIKRIDAGDLAALREQSLHRTLYIFDIRTPEEYRSGHIAGAVSAPGGQLIQTTDMFVGVNNSCIVVVDGPDGLRGAMTVSWLSQFGIGDISLYCAEPSELTQNDDAPIASPPLPHGRYVEPHEVAEAVHAAEMSIIDFASVISILAPSPRVIGGSCYASRESLPTSMRDLPGEGPVLFVSEDGLDAAFAACDITPDNDRELLVLTGGKIAWEKAGFAFADSNHKHSLDPYGPPNAVTSTEQGKASFASYLAWGDTIMEKIRADGTLSMGT